MQILLKNFTFNPKNDVLSEITVALVLVPEAVTFAFVAGIDPLVGLYGAFMMGIVTAIFDGRPGMISGAIGAMAAVIVHLIQKTKAPKFHRPLYHLPQFKNLIETSIDDPRYYVVTDLLDSEV